MRFELPDAKTLTFEMTVPIRWGDMDAMGHVNNAVYFRYFETIRVEWLRSALGIIDSMPEGPVVINAFCTFLKQLRYPGDLRVKHYVANPGRTSFETYVTM